MWHRIENNTVVETTDIDPDGRFHPSLLWVADGGAGAQVGWRYSEESELLSPPDPVPEVPQWPRFIGNAKLDLFTEAEQLAVVGATMVDQVVKLIYDRLLGSAYWSYEDPETEKGLSTYVDKGLLTPERKAEIVAAMQPR